MKLETGQVAVVTGGASGLGLGLVRELAARGLSVVIGDVERGATDEAVAELESRGAPVLGVPVDVRFADQVEALAAATLDRFGRVDIICNNAGVATIAGPTWKVPLEDWTWVLDVNLRGVVHGVRSFVPHLIAQGSGHVVNVASVAGISSFGGMAPYLASKHAVVAMTHGLADELATAAPGVRVTLVCPGAMDTRIIDAERNRPPELTRPGTGFDPDAAAAIMAATTTSSGPGMTMMSGDDAAAIVVAAVEADQPLVLPNGSGDAPRAWMDRIAAGLPDD